jgi:plasmid stability protein
VKNITVTVPDEVYRRARIRAAERETSVSGLVREFLQRLDEGAADFERRKRLQDEVVKSLGRFRGGDRLRRDDLHDRDALR